ncbi:hypothetical protein [Paenibacillus lemnae]|uniref:Lipoprotein n=1 Tax=Paenibacillus lemnae TaxID=1330551 RepID=A0A848M3I2_PAELE|nr:hypothetical protein [Paenibacillus lemnae]NMO95335.1 hypothetical protein [Paenibacillus lemnae]
MKLYKIAGFLILLSFLLNACNNSTNNSPSEAKVDLENETVPMTMFFNLQGAFKGEPQSEIKTIEELGPDSTKYFVPLFRIDDVKKEYRKRIFDGNKNEWLTESIKSEDVQSYPDFLAYAFVMRLFDLNYDLNSIKPWTTGEAENLIIFEEKQESTVGNQTIRLQEHNAIHHIASVSKSSKDDEYLVRVFRMNRPSSGLDEKQDNELFYIQEWKVSIIEKNGLFFVDNVIVMPFSIPG